MLQEFGISGIICFRSPIKEHLNEEEKIPSSCIVCFSSALLWPSLTSCQASISQGVRINFLYGFNLFLFWYFFNHKGEIEILGHVQPWIFSLTPIAPIFIFDLKWSGCTVKALNNGACTHKNKNIFWDSFR